MGALSGEFYSARYEWVDAQDLEFPLLDVGCGQGYQACLIARKYADTTVNAVDIDQEQVACTRGLAAAKQIYNLRVDVLDAISLGFPDESFYSVRAFEILEHLETPQDALREYGRVLVPGGSLYISCPQKGTMAGVHGHIQDFSVADLVRRLDIEGFEILDVALVPLFQMIKASKAQLGPHATWSRVPFRRSVHHWPVLFSIHYWRSRGRSPGAQMKLYYTIDTHVPSGSAHKYGKVFERLATVKYVPGRPDALARALDTERPDGVIAFGDHWGYARECIKRRVPYVLDEHDVVSMRAPGFDAVEREAIENAAAVVFTSEDHMEYCAGRYRLPPSELVHLRPLRSDLQFDPMPKLPGKHLVYAGSVFPWAERTGDGGYRAYERVFEAFTDAGWTVHVYSRQQGDRRVMHECRRMGWLFHEHVPQGQIYRELSQYTAGLQAYNRQGTPALLFEYTQTCRPNKLWEYLAAGIPTIGYNPGRGGAIYDGEWGVVLHNLEHVEELELPAVDIRMRNENVMDVDLPKFERLIAALRTRVEDRGNA